MAKTSKVITLPALHSAQREIAECNARFIVLVSGRRFGKTRLGVLLSLSVGLRGGRAWWIAPTYPMTRVGWRSLKSLSVQIPGVAVRESERTIDFPGGGTVTVRSGDDPDSLRGEGLDFVVLDECAFMKPEVWTDALRPALSDRKGKALFISTPHGGNWFAELYKYAARRNDGDWRAFHHVTADNPYIPPDEIEAAREVLSERLFRQEYLAEILTDVPGALWTRDLLDRWRITEPSKVPNMARVVVGVDPAVTNEEGSSETGIVACGIDASGIGYVLDDKTLKASPEQWARAVVGAYHHHHADRIVPEVNNGGDMIESTLRTVDRTVSIRQVRASRGKYTRAEPIAALFEQGKVRVVGNFPELEDQLCTWVPGDDSPDRLDAMVWALTDLMISRGGAWILR